MKGIVLLVVAGLSLFVGTTVGLLAMQGRLNHKGTQGIPILNSLFAPPEDGEHAEGEHGDGESAAGHDDGHGQDAPGDAAHGGDAHGDAAHGGDAHGAGDAHGDTEPGRLDDLGREEQLSHAVGPSVAGHASPGVPVGRDPAGGHGDAQGGDGHGSDQEFTHGARSLMGQDQYRRGALFKFPQIDSGMSVAELNRVLASANQLRESLDRRETALAQREAELDARDNDIRERAEHVQEKMREVQQARTRLSQEIETFERTYTIVRSSEMDSLRGYADTIAKMDSSRAAELMRGLWQSEEGRIKAAKVLKLMTSDAANEIYAALQPQEVRDILDRLSTTALEASPK
ncbi:MAG: hypothetical protein AAF628_30580 [Planctomycetota bacterium]